MILECFQCGRPDWLEKILFDVKGRHIVNIIMIDYLTAEDYAEIARSLNLQTQTYVTEKFWWGSIEAYNALESITPGTFYFIKNS